MRQAVFVGLFVLPLVFGLDACSQSSDAIDGAGAGEASDSSDAGEGGDNDPSKRDASAQADGASGDDGGKADATAPVPAAGGFDKTFGAGGTVTIPKSGFHLHGLVVLSDGSMVFSGFELNAAQSSEHVWLGKLDAKGALVTAFGTAGWVAHPEPIGASPVTRVTASPQNDLFLLTTNRHRVEFRRLTSSGSFVASFGTNGVTTITFPHDPTAFYPHGFVYGADNHLYAGGQSVIAGYPDIAVARLDSAGTNPIHLFVSPGGDRPRSLGGFISQLDRVGDDIWVTGKDNYASSTKPGVPRLRKVNGGGVTVDVGGIAHVVGAWSAGGGKVSALEDDQKGKLSLLRIASNALDATFGTGGRVSLPAICSNNLLLRQSSVVGRPDGGFYVVTPCPGTTPVSITRFDVNGALVPGFGSNGVVTVPYDAEIPTLTLQKDGKLLLWSGTKIVRLVDTN